MSMIGNIATKSLLRQSLTRPSIFAKSDISFAKPPLTRNLKPFHNLNAGKQSLLHSSGMKTSNLFSSRSRTTTISTSLSFSSAFSSRRFYSTEDNTKEAAKEISESGDEFLSSLEKIVNPEVASATTEVVTETATKFEPPAFLWAPVELAEKLLTFVQESSGLPWWCTIVAVTFGLRTMVLPAALLNFRNSARLQAISKPLKGLQDRMNAARSEGDYELQMRLWQEMSELQKSVGAGMFRPFKYMFFQVPIFVTMFLALREMSTTMLSLKTGGVFWFTDLTLPDPYYLLPALSACGFVATFEVGGDGNPQTASSRKMMRPIMYIMSVVVLFATSGFPAALHVYWASTSVFTLLQTSLLKVKPLRRKLGFVDPVKIDPEKLSSHRPKKVVNAKK